MTTQISDQLVITSGQNPGSNGLVHLQHRYFPCKIGRNGIGHKKGEGDSITPIGNWKMAYFLYRAEKITKPRTILPGFAIKPQDSWCDISQSRHYNLPLAITPENSSEALWRGDSLYDLIIVLDHNTCPAIAGQGSAVFIHLSEPQTCFTQGCIALRQPDLLKILMASSPQTRVMIRP